MIAKLVFKKPIDDPKPLMRFGMLFLGLALAWPKFIPVTGNLGPDAIDGIKGLLMGIAFGVLGWSVILNNRLRRAGRK
jgi:hypothetical protein